MKVAISTEELFEYACRKANVDPAATDHINTEYCVIHKSTENGETYYDLSDIALLKFQGAKGRVGIAAMDGETCIVTEKEQEIVFLKQEDEEIPFRLTLAEFDNCCVPVNQLEVHRKADIHPEKEEEREM